MWTTISLLEHLKTSSFRCKLAKASAKLQQHASRCVVTLAISCAFLHADVEPGDEHNVELPKEIGSWSRLGYGVAKAIVRRKKSTDVVAKTN